jgi:AraC family transcriptional regulator of adaptative response/methylated-DNA-[protein]-cysteine methyltransferase
VRSEYCFQIENSDAPETVSQTAVFDLKARIGARRISPTSKFALQRIWKVTTMRETIRFAWGISSLGDFVVVMSDKGIVALEFSAMHSAMEDAVRNRFPEAELERSQEGLAAVIDVVARVIDDPSANCDLPLDLRGTPYEIQIWHLLREIPAGQTTSYGALAAKLGSRDTRDVAAAVSNNPIAVIVPCHRVIKKDGSISGYRWGVCRKRALLKRHRANRSHPW